MDSTMRARLRRVHILQRYALVFIGAVACVLPAWGQTHCADLSIDAQAPQGQWRLATRRADGDVLRYDGAGSTCEVPLQGQVLEAPQTMPGTDQAAVALRDGRVILLPLRGKPWPWKQLALEGRITAVATSAPGQAAVLAVATRAPLALVFLGPDLQPLQRLLLVDKTALHSSAVCTLLVSPQRQSFVALFADMGELWELSYNPLAAEIGLGMVHDFQYREGHFVPGYLNPLRTALPWNVAAGGLDADGHMVQLHSRTPVRGADTLVIHLDVRKPVTEAVHMAAPLRPCEKPKLLPK